MPGNNTSQPDHFGILTCHVIEPHSGSKGKRNNIKEGGPGKWLFSSAACLTRRRPLGPIPGTAQKASDSTQVTASSGLSHGSCNNMGGSHRRGGSKRKDTEDEKLWSFTKLRKNWWITEAIKLVRLGRAMHPCDPGELFQTVSVHFGAFCSWGELYLTVTAPGVNKRQADVGSSWRDCYPKIMSSTSEGKDPTF